MNKDIPYLYGDLYSNAPWLWQIPQEILDSQAEIATKDISKRAILWRATFERCMKDYYSLEDTEKIKYRVVITCRAVT